MPTAPRPDLSGKTDAIGQTQDMGVSTLERAQTEPAIRMRQRSLLEVGRDHAVIQYEHQNINSGLGRAPLVHTAQGRDRRLSLFNGMVGAGSMMLVNDPRETSNLRDLPDHASQRAKLFEPLARPEILHVDRAPFPLAQARACTPFRSGHGTTLGHTQETWIRPITSST